MQRITTILLSLILIFISIIGTSKELEEEVSLSGSTLQTRTTLDLEDVNYNCIVGNNCSPLVDVFKSSFHVKLSYDETERSHYTTSWNVDVSYEIALYDLSGNRMGPIAGNLHIDYHPDAGYTYTDIDYDLYDSKNYIKAEVTDISVTSSLATLPADIHLDLVYKSEQYDAMDITRTPILHSPIYDGSKEELRLSWPKIDGAETYDLEWLFIDIGEDDPSIPGDYEYDYDFRNATRITTSNTNYTISLAYPKGYFLFRARAIQDKQTSSGTTRLVGNWTSQVSKGVISSVQPLYSVFPPYTYGQHSSVPTCPTCGPGPPPHRKVYFFAGLEPTKNWQYSVTYAEEGKRKEAITYFDGTLRNRQQVTVSSTDDIAIVGETIYDYVGRPAVNTLPSPQSENKGMQYYPDQNKSSSIKQYDYENFDTDGKFDDPDKIDEVHSKGGAHYYSTENTSPFGINKQYIPTAQGYSYTRVQYKNDGTNRVRKQSGVGEAFRMGGKKETQYLYSTPTQTELDRLFGNEAGFASMYKKNTVVDPNGQASISYIDNYGRTIATALSGDIGDKLLAIDTRPVDFEFVKSNLSLSNRKDDKGRQVVTQVLSITSPTTVTFNYTLLGDNLSNACIDYKDYYYDYEIYITNEYNQKVPFSDGNLIKSKTGVTSASVLDFTVDFTEVGTYKIHKILSLNAIKLADYIQSLSDTNACLDIVIDSTTVCNPSCEEACWSSHISVNPITGDTIFIDHNGDSVALVSSTGNITITGSLYRGGSKAEDKLDSIRTEVLNCIDSCSMMFDSVFDLDPCEVKYRVLKADMSPGGQYFEAMGMHGQSNGWLTEHIGENPHEIFCYDMPDDWDVVRATWDDSWGDVLVTYHPEWCAYQTECCPVLIGEDCSMVTTISTSVGGICDPTVVEGMIASELGNFLNTGYSVTDLFGTSTFPVNYQPVNNDLDDLLNLLYNPTDGVIRVEKVMTPSEFMASIHDFYYEKAKYNYIKYNCQGSDTDSDQNSGLYLDDVNGKTAEGFYVRYLKNPLFESFELPFNAVNTVNNITQLAVSACSTQAERLTDQFMEAFVCKLSLGPDTVSLRQEVLAAMYYNCANNNPPHQGLDSKVMDFLTSGGYPTGCLTGAWFEDLNESCQCDNLFNFIASANNISLSTAVTNGSYSSTLLSTNALASVLSHSDITVKGIDPANLSTNLSSWYSSCNTNPFVGMGSTGIPDYLTCTKDSIPYDTNACVTTINEQAYTNELFRIRGLVMEAITTYRERYYDKFHESIQTNEEFTMEYLLQEYHYTLYYYDQAGNLIKTVPPEGVYQKSLAGRSTPAHSSILNSSQLSLVDAHRRSSISTPFIQPEHIMVTNYKYNSLNQLTSQFTPDGGSSRFFYDDLGRLVASQNADQLLRSNALGKYIYSYTQFDALGRIVEVGEIEHSSELTEETSRNKTAWASWINKNYLSSPPVYRTQIVNTYYDDQNTSILPLTVLTQQNLRNRIASVTYNEDGDKDRIYPNQYESASHYTYDINGNVNTLVQENKNKNLSVNSERYKRIDYEYDLVGGNVNKVSYQSGEKDEFYHKYEYDSDNRLTVAYTSRNDVIWEKESKNLYYAHGPLARIELGDKQVEAQDYAYTLQGWLKTINSSMGHQDRDIGKDGVRGIHENFGRDAYGFSLHYYSGDYQSIDNSSSVTSTIAQYGTGNFKGSVKDLYNGNISAMILGLTKEDNTRAQVIGNTYRYDQLNRIKEYTPFLSEEAGEDHVYELNSLHSSNNVSKRYNSTYTYDGNGNIESLTRNGSKLAQDPNDPNATIATPLAMDNFHYEYLNKNGSGAKTNNQLDHVADVVDEDNYTNDLDNQDGENYEYDEIGRLIRDDKELIELIEWNVANKITRIKKDGGNQIIEFDYDPMGNRISKTNIVSTGVTTTYYVRDAQGNVMATYKASNVNNNKDMLYSLNDFHIYGSSRLGTKEENKTLFTNGVPPNTDLDRSYRKLGEKRYELSNHLGNVLEVISDRKLIDKGDEIISEAFTTAPVVGNVWRGNSTHYTTTVDNYTMKISANKRLDYGTNKSITTTTGSTYEVTFDADFCDGTEKLWNIAARDEINGNWHAGTRISSGANVFSFTATSNKTKIKFELYEAGYNGTQTPVNICLSNIIITKKGLVAIDDQVISEEFISVPVVDNVWRGNSTYYTTTVENYTMKISANKRLNYGANKTITTTTGSTYEVTFDAAFCDGPEKLWNIAARDEVNGTWYSGTRISSGANVFSFTANSNRTRLKFELYEAGYNGTQTPVNICINNILIKKKDQLFYTADVISYSDYYPFGMLMPNRHGSSADGYRYGFNGMEKDDEVRGTKGASYDFGARMLDPRVGRWLSVDPKSAKLPGSSTYSFVVNSPMMLVDPDGELPIIPILLWAGKRIAAGAIADVAVQIASEWVSGGGTLGQAWDRLEIDAYQVVRSAGENLVSDKYSAAALSAAGDAIDYIIANDDWTWEGVFQAGGEGAISSLLGDKLGKAVLKKIKMPKSFKKSAPDSDSKAIEGYTEHGLERKINREVKSKDVLDAVKNPLKKGDVKIDNKGRPSQRYTGEKAETVLNPDTKKVISVNPTSKKKAARLKRQNTAGKAKKVEPESNSFIVRGR